MKYPDFVRYTGYGDILGIGGVNCRHSWGGFDPQFQTPNYTDEDLAKMKAKDAIKRKWETKNRKGENIVKEFDHYGATQEQRRQERIMREQRAKIVGYREAGAKEELEAKSRYAEQRAVYKRFSKKMGLDEQFDRVYLDGLGRLL